MPNTSPPTDQDHSSKKRRGRTRRGRRGGRKTRRGEPPAQASPSEPVAKASSELDIGIVFAERSEPPERPPLLDAAAARRLAADARRREQASREALEATRRALGRETPTREPVVEAGGDDTPARAAGPRSATTPRPLDSVQTDSSALREPETRAPAPRTPAHESPGWQRVPLQPKIADERSQELEATLAIARETALAQRAELAELRNELESRADRIAGLEATLERSTTAAATAADDERVAMQNALEESRREIGSLRERLTLEDRAYRTLDAEKQLLGEKLEAQESALAARNTRIDELRDRLEAQEEALHAARREYELERARHSASLQVLDTLRSLLTEPPDVDPAAPHIVAERFASDPAEQHSEHLTTTPQTMPRTTPDEAPQAPEALTFAGVESPPLPAETAAAEPVPATPGATLAERADAAPVAMLPPIFDAWQDDQIRRQFGPMGIDCFGDLLRVPLSRNASARFAPQTILLIGRGAAGVAGALAESLVRHELGAFQIHVADPSGEGALDASPLSNDSPLREFITPVGFPQDPDALDATLACLQPRVIVSRDFLSREADIAAWLACLERATTRGASLVFSEGTGTPSTTPPPEVTQVGERIWELMPERYTRVPGTDRRFEHWREAFDTREAARPNELVAGLRERFRLAMFTQFGFLAEPFLTSPIGWNFDPEAPRDRRFLALVADLDDRRIEAGLVPALHLVALVDPLADD